MLKQGTSAEDGEVDGVVISLEMDGEVDGAVISKVANHVSEEMTYSFEFPTLVGYSMSTGKRLGVTLTGFGSSFVIAQEQTVLSTTDATSNASSALLQKHGMEVGHGDGVGGESTIEEVKSCRCC